MKSLFGKLGLSLPGNYIPMVLRLLILLVSVLLTLQFVRLDAQELPEDFFVAPVVTDLDYPLGLTFDDNGQMYVWEKAGIVWVYDSLGQRLPDPLIDLSERIAHYAEHGLNYFLLDKNYLQNGRIFVYHVLDLHWYYNFGTPDYDPAFSITTEATIGRLSSFIVDDPAGNAPVADLSSENILLGTDLKDGIPILMTSHGIGSVQQAEDGTLLLSNGDGASFLGTDVGSDSLESRISSALEHGIIQPHQDIGSYKSQYRNVLNGKILRIDPDTGDGLTSNPFYVSGEPRHPSSRIWAYGFRNPYRMVVKPQSGDHDPTTGKPGLIITGDVGAAAWEEINIVPEAGMNFGWPIFEGNRNHWGFNNYPDIPNQFAPNPEFGINGCTREFFGFKELTRNRNNDGTNLRYNHCNQGRAVSAEDGFVFTTPPALFWNNRNYNPGDFAATAVWNDEQNFMDRQSITVEGSPIEGDNFTGEASLGGVFYTATNYPPAYHNAYFHLDYSGWIKVIYLDENDKIFKISPFADNLSKPNHLALNPVNGNLYYIALEEDQINMISYGGNPPPVAKTTEDQFAGGAQLTVNFDASPSYDPNGTALAYHWDFGDGNEASGITAQHTFATSLATPENFIVLLTVTDEEGASDQTELLVSLNNSAPQATITSFSEGDLYPTYQSSLLDLAASVNDSETPTDDLKISWQAFLHHNTHFHPETSTTDLNSHILLTPAGCSDDGNYWYRIRLTVEDPQGLKTVTEQSIFPNCSLEPINWVNLSGVSVESGIQLNISTDLADEVAKLEVQRSPDFFAFQTIGTLEPEVDQSYSSLDPAPLTGVSYYRIKVSMTDGSFHFSDPEPIAYNTDSGHLLSPNPASGSVVIDIYRAVSENAEISFFALNGQQLFRSNLPLIPGDPMSQRIDLSSLPAGMYLYRIIDGDTSYQGKIMINQ